MRFIFPCADPFFSRGFRGSAHPQAQVDKFQVWVSGWTLKKCGNGKSFNSQLKKKKSFFGRRISFNPQFFPFPSHSTPGRNPKRSFPHPCPSKGSTRLGGGKKGNIGNLRIREAQNTTFLGGRELILDPFPAFDLDGNPRFSFWGGSSDPCGCFCEGGMKGHGHKRWPRMETAGKGPGKGLGWHCQPREFN